MAIIFNINNKVIGKFIQSHEILESTNDEASKYTHSKLEYDGLVISTGVQKSGRGQRGTAWSAEKGKNILCSIVLYPRFLEVKDHFYLNMIVSLGVGTFIKGYYNLEAQVKWPNDIYIQGKKVGGILIETSIQGRHFQYAIVGIGLNINQEVFGNLDRAGSIKQFTGIDSDIKKALYALTTHLDKSYQLLIKKDFKSIKNAYLDSLFLKGQSWTYYDIKEKEIRGEIIDVNNLGQLIIQDENGCLKPYSFKEIRFFK